MSKYVIMLELLCFFTNYLTSVHFQCNLLSRSDDDSVGELLTMWRETAQKQEVIAQKLEVKYLKIMKEKTRTINKVEQACYYDDADEAMV
jgi:hypothetical protein